MSRHRLAVALGAAALLVPASSAAASGTHWAKLKSVTVTLQNPSLPPPGGAAHTTRFATAAKVKTATAALNANHIAKAAVTSNDGCTGGTNVVITIVPTHGSTTKLSAYQCGSQTFGNIGGNLAGFLKAVGLGS